MFRTPSTIARRRRSLYRKLLFVCIRASWYLCKTPSIRRLRMTIWSQARWKLCWVRLRIIRLAVITLARRGLGVLNISALEISVFVLPQLDDWVLYLPDDWLCQMITSLLLILTHWLGMQEWRTMTSSETFIRARYLIYLRLCINNCNKKIVRWL